METPEDYDNAIAAAEKRARLAARPLGGMTYSQVCELEKELKSIGGEIKELRRKKNALIKRLEKNDFDAKRGRAVR